MIGLCLFYTEKYFDADTKKRCLCPVVSSDGRDGSVLVHQDTASVYTSIMNGHDLIQHHTLPKRMVCFHLIGGHIIINVQHLNARDALKITDEAKLTIDNAINAEFLLFDLPIG